MISRVEIQVHSMAGGDPWEELAARDARRAVLLKV
jgi:hypothetical protein